MTSRRLKCDVAALGNSALFLAAVVGELSAAGQEVLVPGDGARGGAAAVPSVTRIAGPWSDMASAKAIEQFARAVQRRRGTPRAAVYALELGAGVERFGGGSEPWVSVVLKPPFFTGKSFGVPMRRVDGGQILIAVCDGGDTGGFGEFGIEVLRAALENLTRGLAKALPSVRVNAVLGRLRERPAASPLPPVALARASVAKLVPVLMEETALRTGQVIETRHG